MTTRKGDPLALRPIGVATLRTNELVPNPHNPRLLFDRKPLDVLRDSIEKVGILVPLTVYQGSKSGKYVILDGQRRWMAAQELGLAKVPVNVVAEPTLVQNIVTMFQIHRLREDWELMPTALKLEVLMRELKEVSANRLAELTGLDVAVVSRCKKLLSYPKRFQDMMLDFDPTRRVKADFFIELYPVRNDRLMRSLEWFKPDRFTDRMLQKYQAQKGLKAVTDFRVIKQHITNARKAQREREIAKRLKEFAESDDLPLEHVEVRAANVGAQARKLTVAINALAMRLQQLDVEDYYGEEKLWAAIAELVRIGISTLSAADKRVA